MGRAETELQRMVKHAQVHAKTRTPWRHRKKSQGKLTSIQKVQRKLAYLDRKESINKMLDDARAKVMAMAEEIHTAYPRHSTNYYYQLVMQESRLARKARAPSRWNAFLSLEMERLNADVSGDRKHVSQDQITQEIAARWHAMSEGEQTAATEERLKEIADRRSTRNRKTITTPVQVFNDNRATTKAIEEELKALNVRTGRNALLLMTSPGTTEFGQAYAFYTNERISDFIMLLTKCTVPQLAIKMEGYCLSGVRGLKLSYKNTVVALKTEASNIINSKLSEISGGRLTQVKYKNFDRHVTENTGIVVDRWPLPIFRAPGDISSTAELQTLIDAWVTGATTFRVMDEEEFRAWRRKRQSINGPNALDDTDARSTNSDPLAASDAPAPEAVPTPPGPASPAPSSPGSSHPDPSASTSLPSSMAMTSSPQPMVSPPGPPPDANAGTQKFQTMFINVNVVTGADGNSIAVSTRPRKTRSDKGTRRKAKSPAQVNSQAAPLATAASTSTTPLPAAPKPHKKAKQTRTAAA